jgi:hypothetical protein
MRSGTVSVIHPISLRRLRREERVADMGEMKNIKRGFLGDVDVDEK